MGATLDRMKKFHDKTGREWSIDLSFGLWRRIKADCGIDLLDVAMPDGKALQQLSRLEVLAEVLWAYVADQAASAGITREQFWDALDGAAVHAGVFAIVGDLEDFSRSPSFAALRVSMEEAATKTAQVCAAMAAPDGDARRMAREAMAGLSSTPGGTPASAPASSAPTPTPGASASSTGQPEPSAVNPGTVQP